MNRYRLLKMNSRGGHYYAEEIETCLRRSLRAADREEAEKLLHALNESHRNPHLNQRMAQTYLVGSDSAALSAPNKGKAGHDQPEKMPSPALRSLGVRVQRLRGAQHHEW